MPSYPTPTADKAEAMRPSGQRELQEIVIRRLDKVETTLNCNAH